MHIGHHTCQCDRCRAAIGLDPKRSIAKPPSPPPNKGENKTDDVNSIKNDLLKASVDIQRIVSDFYAKHGLICIVDINWLDATSSSDIDVVMSPVVTVSAEVVGQSY